LLGVHPGLDDFEGHPASYGLLLLRQIDQAKAALAQHAEQLASAYPGANGFPGGGGTQRWERIFFSPDLSIICMAAHKHVSRVHVPNMPTRILPRPGSFVSFESSASLSTDPEPRRLAGRLDVLGILGPDGVDSPAAPFLIPHKFSLEAGPIRSD
jgi:hypothetical protein